MPHQSRNIGFSRAQVVRHLRTYNRLRETMPNRTAAYEMGIPLHLLNHWLRNADTYLVPDGPWQDTVKGKTWKDMPGGDDFTQRANFALWRRGKLNLEDPPSGGWYGGGSKAVIAKKRVGRPPLSPEERASRRIQKAAVAIESDAADASDVDFFGLKEEPDSEWMPAVLSSHRRG